MIKEDLAEDFDMGFKGELWIKSYTKIGDCCGERNILTIDSYTGYGG